MADEKITGQIDIRELASKKVIRLRRELELLGGKTAVKTDKEIRKLERSIGRLSPTVEKTTPLISRFTAGIAKGNLIAMAGQKAFSLLSDSFAKLGEATLLAARVETLNRVVTFTGRNAGHTGAQIKGFRDEIISLGITQRSSLEIMQRFLQAELDVADATKIARLAQDAATIAGINSSDAALQMTDAVNKLSPRLLRQFGIMVDLNTVYRDASRELGKSADSLTAFERKQALLNAVLEQGKTIAGVYETAMETTGKRITSLPRLFENASVAVGQHFVPALGLGVDALSGFLGKVELFANAFAGSEMAKPNEWLEDFNINLRSISETLAAQLDILPEWKAAMQGVAFLSEDMALKQFEAQGKAALWGGIATGVASAFGWMTGAMAAYDEEGKTNTQILEEQAIKADFLRTKLNQLATATTIKAPIFDKSMIGPDANLLEPPPLLQGDVLEAAATGMASINKQMKISNAEAEYFAFRAEVAAKGMDDLGGAGELAGGATE